MLAGKFALLATLIGAGAVACSTVDAKDIPPNTIRQLGTSRWYPDSLDVAVGTTVRWDIYAGIHELWFTAEPDTILRNFSGGESFERQFPIAGAYEFICSFPNHTYLQWPELFWS